MSYAAYDQEAILGRLLMDIVHGELTDETIWLVDQLDRNDIPLPMGHLVGYVQGMNMDPEMRQSISRDLVEELRIITEEQREEIWPTPPDETPIWPTDAPIPDRTASIIKDLLLETLKGKISYETLTAIDDLGDLEDVPEPYNSILSFLQVVHEDGKEIARGLLDILGSIIYRLKELRS